MNTFGKIATTIALTGALAAALATPSEARVRHWGAVGAGVAAGAVVGAAAANAANSNYYGYGPTYGYYGNGYGYNSYAYVPGRQAPSSYYGSSYGNYGYGAGEDRVDGNYGYFNEGIGAVR